MIDFIYLGDYELNKPDVAAPTSSASLDVNEPVHENAAEATKSDVDRGAQNLLRKRKKKRAIRYDSSEEELGPESLIGAPTGIAQSKGSLSMHTRVYALAVKYGLKDLQNLAKEKMKQAVRGTWDREDFAKAIAVAFGATPHGDMGMRDIIMSSILDCSASLVSDPVVEEAISAVDGLAFELFKRQSTSSKRQGY